VVVVDPGHNRIANPALEPIGPGASVRKIMDGGGARGVVSGVPEADVTLAVALRLRVILRRAGVSVVMTRTTTEGVSMGNVARARIANRSRAQLFVRVHADGADEASVHGTHTLYPALQQGWTDDIYAASRRAAALLQRELVRELRSRDRGINPRADITGFNWSDVPVVLPELGFLSNPGEDRLLTSARYQHRAAVGLCRGIMLFLARPAAACR
jgi:N-acetylmuramoyl-L-alanine amidase